MKLNAAGSWWSKSSFSLLLLSWALNAMADQVNEIKLRLNQTQVLNDAVQLTLQSIITEIIEPSPEDEQNYPAGSGVLLSIEAKCNDKVEQIELSILSPPYHSQDRGEFCGIDIHVLEAEGDSAILSTRQSIGHSINRSSNEN